MKRDCKSVWSECLDLIKEQVLPRTFKTWFAPIRALSFNSGSFALIQETLNLCGDGFSVWSGNDEDTAAVCALGGAGVISVAANIVPREMHRLVELCLADRILEAGCEQLRLAPLIRALFCEVNPIPIKTAMARMGLCSDLLRLPLCEMSEENRARLFAAMNACGVSA